MDNMDSLLREKEVAAILGLSTNTLRKWRSLRKGPNYVKLGGYAVRYSREDVEAFKEQRKIQLQ